MSCPRISPDKARAHRRIGRLVDCHHPLVVPEFVPGPVVALMLTEGLDNDQASHCQPRHPGQRPGYAAAPRPA
jgi:hypothetical protein